MTVPISAAPGAIVPDVEETGHYRATDTGARVDRVAVGNALSGAKPGAGAPGRREAIGEAARDIGHARPFASTSSSMPDRSASGNPLIATRPPPAYFTRLIAISVATSAIRASTSWAIPFRRAWAAAVRHASPTWLVLRTQLITVISQLPTISELPTRQRDGRPFARC
jgi:hypothetical protein